MTGRPSKFSEELAQEICHRLAEGETLKQICEDDDKPHIGTVCRWVSEKPGFRELYERAREAQCEFFLEEIIEIADESINFHYEVGQARNRIDARKWAMSKLAVRRYGDKTLITGADGTSPAKLVVSWDDGGWSSESKSPTDHEISSEPSTPVPSASVASLLTGVAVKPSPVSTTSSVPPLDVDWSDHDLPILHPIEDKPKP